MPNKRKVSLTLDADLVEALELDADGALSSQVNSAIRAEVERRLRHRALGELLAELEDEDGPLTDQDESEIERYRQLLSG